MKIGIDIRMAGTRHGGIGRYILELVKNLLAIDAENEYFLFYNDDSADEIKALKGEKYSPAVFIKANVRHYSLSEQIKLPKILGKFALDLCHFPNFNAPIFYRRPFVATIHDMVHHKISGHKKSSFLHFFGYKQIIAQTAKRAVKILTVSQYSKDEITKFLKIPPEKIKVIYEGCSLAEPSPDSIAQIMKKYFLRRPYFLFVGVLERKKNLPNLCRGFDLFLKKTGANFDLVIAGKSDPHYPEIKFRAMEITNKNRLVFMDFVEDGDLAALYQNAFAFVSASLHEGFGLPGVEAMKFGLPLAVSDTPVFNEIYDNGAIYFNPLDPADIAEKMNFLAADARYREQLIQNSLRRGKLFDWKKTAEETLRAYREASSLGK